MLLCKHHPKKGFFIMSKKGFQKLIVWQNAYKLRRMIFEITKNFPKNEMRRVSQMNDAARSIKQNIQEGYGSSLPQYINYLRIAKGSLSELIGDIRDCYDDGLIDVATYEKLDELAGKTDYLFMRLIQSLNKLKKP